MEYIKQKEKILIGDTGYYYNINEGGWFNPKGVMLKYSPLSRIEKDFTDDKNPYAILLHYNRSIQKAQAQAFDLVYNFVKTTYPDKLQEYFTDGYWHYGYNIGGISNDICQFVIDNKKLLKKFFETQNPKKFILRDIANWIKSYTQEQYFLQIIPNATEREVQNLIYYCNNLAYYNCDKKTVVKYVYKMLHNQNLFLWENEKSESVEHYDIRQRLQRMITACNTMKISFPNGEFIRDYVTIMKNYEIYQEQIDNTFFATYKNRTDLLFEDENYTVVLPACKQDMIDEAFYQCNCVFRCYYKSLIGGQTNIVFIRDKQNPTKSLITCEVRNDGIIEQYRLQHNQIPCADSQLKFRIKYQAYLKEVFNND